MSGKALQIIDAPDQLDRDELAEPLEQCAGQFLGYHTLDYQAGMSGILGDRFRQLALRDSDGRLAAYMQFRERSGPFGVIVNALPFFGPNGLLAAREPSWRDQLLTAFRETVTRPDVISAVLYTPFLVDPAPIADVFQPNFRLPKQTQYIDLSRVLTWPKARRGDIKKAQQAGFVLRRSVPADLSRLYAIYTENCADARVPLKPFSYFDLTMNLALGATAEDRASPLWLTAELEGTVVAGLLAMRGNATVSYTIPIAASKIRALQPISLLIDTAIDQSRAAGYRYWNFESSPTMGDPVYKYKERWGSQTAAYEIQGYYPNGADRAESMKPADLAQYYPGYFAYPFRKPVPSESGACEAS